jgi:hypothetical protein
MWLLSKRHTAETGLDVQINEQRAHDSLARQPTTGAGIWALVTSLAA